MSGREAHAKYALSIYMIFKYASVTGNPNLSHASVIFFNDVGLKRDDPAEILMLYRDTSNFREDLALITP
jgi:hypothetical protein